MRLTDGNCWARNWFWSRKSSIETRHSSRHYRTRLKRKGMKWRHLEVKISFLISKFMSWKKTWSLSTEFKITTQHFQKKYRHSHCLNYASTSSARVKNTTKSCPTTKTWRTNLRSAQSLFKIWVSKSKNSSRSKTNKWWSRRSCKSCRMKRSRSRSLMLSSSSKNKSLPGSSTKWRRQWSRRFRTT